VCAGERGHEARWVVRIGGNDIDAGVGERARLFRRGISRDRAGDVLAVGIGKDLANEAAALCARGAEYRDDLPGCHLDGPSM
jgi:hypothetical protein